MPNNHYDVIVIGAGMSGLAAAIRPAMYDKKVLLIESHSIPGGLNSYYKRGKREFDVGLHALTNYVSKDKKGHPLNKLLKQLRLSYDELKLDPQNYSEIHFPQNKIKFTNDADFLYEEICTKFPHEKEGYLKLLEVVKNFNEVDLNAKEALTRPIIKQYINDDTLIEMLLCPLLIYGSAWENDMDFSQFVIMFKSIYLEGFARPEGGVRTILSLLNNKIDELKISAGLTVRYKTKVTKIITHNDQAIGVIVNGEEEIYGKAILSSMGLLETMNLCPNYSSNENYQAGVMSFSEVILHTNIKPRDLGIDSTIIFYNEREKYLYQKPTDFFDPKSAVICFPQNFMSKENTHDEEGVIRLTHMANYNLYQKSRDENKIFYQEKKAELITNAKRIMSQLTTNKSYDITFSDIFTPATIQRYTGHINGAVYGSTTKVRNGITSYKNLYIIGTDQGFLGIVGSMLSGISMANLHVLSKGTGDALS